MYKHPVYSAIWAAATTQITSEMVTMTASGKEEVTFVWKCDLRAAMGGAAPPSSVSVLRVGEDAYAAVARFPDEDWLYADSVAKVGRHAALVQTVESVARDGRFYFPGNPDLELPVGMITAGFSALCHVQTVSPLGDQSAIVVGNLTFADGGMSSLGDSWDPNANAVSRTARFLLRCWSQRPCDTDEQARTGSEKGDFF